MKLEDTTLELEPEFVSVGSRILISPDIMSIMAGSDIGGWVLSSFWRKMLQEREQMDCGWRESEDSEMTRGSWLWTQAGNDTQR